MSGEVNLRSFSSLQYLCMIFPLAARVNVSDGIMGGAVEFAEAQLTPFKQHKLSELPPDFNQWIDPDTNTLGFGIGGVAQQEIYDSDCTHIIASEMLAECSQE